MTHTPHPHTLLRKIDVFLSVIDNYGDIGFATELLIAFERAFPKDYQFRIFTDNVMRVREFMTQNHTLLPVYELLPLDASEKLKRAPITFLLFHFPLPEILSRERHLVLRIDYLSFDREWISRSGTEHITSTKDIPIIEIIPSLFPEGAGCLDPIPQEYISRGELLEKLHLAPSLVGKKWITFYPYIPTFERFDFRTLSPDEVVFTFGGLKKETQVNVHTLPFLDIETYHTLLTLSDLNIVRGEVSALAAMQVSKPFLWDMYKERGGFPSLMSEQFLDYFNFSESYRGLHREINTRETPLDFSQIADIIGREKVFLDYTKQKDTSQLIETLKKYIDRFYFSL